MSFTVDSLRDYWDNRKSGSEGDGRKRCYGRYRLYGFRSAGGDAEIAAMVVRKEIDLAVFLIDDLNPQPHEGPISRCCFASAVSITCYRL